MRVVAGLVSSAVSHLSLSLPARRQTALFLEHGFWNRQVTLRCVSVALFCDLNVARRSYGDR